MMGDSRPEPGPGEVKADRANEDPISLDLTPPLPLIGITPPIPCDPLRANPNLELLREANSSPEGGGEDELDLTPSLSAPLLPFARRKRSNDEGDPAEGKP